MYRNLLGLLAVFAGAIVLVGLTFSATAETRADYVFVNASEPKTLDPQKMTGQPEGRIADALFEGLTFRDNDTLDPVPGQSESWTTSEDGKTWKFRMRPGIRWSNGDPVTAHDFVYSWVRLQEPKIASEYAYLMHFVRHAEAYNTYGAHVKALRGDPDGDSSEARQGIVGGFEALLARHPGGVPVKEWVAFLDARAVRDAITRTRDAPLLAALARDAGTFTPEEGSAVLASLRAEAERRAAALVEARAHFGKDQGVFAPDERTFVVELNAYTPYFLELTAFYVNYAVHRETVERWPDNWFSSPDRIVTNGPFRMETWDVNRKIRMRKNPDYWAADEVTLETVDCLPIENRTTMFNLFMTGAVDWAPSGYPPDLIDTVKRMPQYRSNPGMIVYLYRINCTRPPLTDPRVRRAIGLAFDRQVITDKVLRAGQRPAVALVAPGVPDYESPPSALGYDVETARRLLAEAGFPGGRGFPTIGIVYNTDEGHKKVAEYISGELRKNLGITVNAVNQEWQSYQESVQRLNYDIARFGWIGDYRDPNTFLDMWITKGGNNQTGWGDPFFDRLIALAADPMSMLELTEAEKAGILSRLRERPKAEALLAAARAAQGAEARLAAAAALRLQVFREAEAILINEAFCVLPIYFYVTTNLIQPYVEGFHTEVVEPSGRRIPNLQDQHPYRNVRVRRGGR
jgi:oligopeptide transport system substrate-binding protein